MDLWIWSEEAGALVKVESLRVKAGFDDNEWRLFVCNASGETIIARYATRENAMAAVKKIAMELDSFNKQTNDIKVLAVKKTGQVASLLAAV